MSCYVLAAESFEALAVSLAHHKIKVPSPDAPRHVATPEAWAALAWAASDSNVIAYRHRYRESADVHPLEFKHGTWEAFLAWQEVGR